mmetsp:Transcript_12267/g.27314  ORF Transcript_12267/g.27314 Transcript_12267/m.27314 type:complete len:474 (+) Transcript_12267:25-1446(+)|eukprot:CAMPEP_0204328188 /NCGR_PEP_ID=MMETSP0469-20131031/13179_1 /ASSEMBLY_ACC=CAM_ASM_000384 /TAXON_ID=2969 /ORGANISM="Oxyrrhis marina" /LENGTH=473 /DNA_ID=CAMNT_0051310543 /DNA_START=13 /DNA_END=1434 /DNA_ORIENTATION=-
MAEEGNPFQAITAPLALVLQPPAAPARSGLTCDPAALIAQCEEELALEEKLFTHAREVIKQAQTLRSRAVSRMHRGDLPGAAELVQKLRELPGPEQILAEATPDQRLRLYGVSGLGSLTEQRVSVEGLYSFVTTGKLTVAEAKPMVPELQCAEDERWLLGLLMAADDLRPYAVNRAQVLDLHSLQHCLKVAQCLEEALLQFDLRNSDLRRRSDGLKYVVKKFEELVYEVTMGLQRDGKFDEVAAAAPVAAPDSPPSIDLTVMAAVRERYVWYDLQREAILKQSRDVAKNGKNAVHSLQRGDFKRCASLLETCAKDADRIDTEIVSKCPGLRSSLAYPVEEVMEALAFRAFLKDSTVPSLAEIQVDVGKFKVCSTEYLGALSDLTGEVLRQGIRSAQTMDTEKFEKCLSLVQAVHTGFCELTSMSPHLRKKANAVGGSVTKLEAVKFEQTLLKTGRSKMAGAIDLSGPDEGEAD